MGGERREGAAVSVPPGRLEAWEDHPWNQPRINALTDDGGCRYDAFWDWVDSRSPDEPLWQLDSIAVEPAARRRFGAALIAAGLARARADGVGGFLSTGTRRNVSIYGRCGFRVVEDIDAPGGGPHIWFMRWPVGDVERSLAFYLAVLGPLGLREAERYVRVREHVGTPCGGRPSEGRGWGRPVYLWRVRRGGPEASVGVRSPEQITHFAYRYRERGQVEHLPYPDVGKGLQAALGGGAGGHP